MPTKFCYLFSDITCVFTPRASRGVDLSCPAGDPPLKGDGWPHPRCREGGVAALEAGRGFLQGLTPRSAASCEQHTGGHRLGGWPPDASRHEQLGVLTSGRAGLPRYGFETGWHRRPGRSAARQVWASTVPMGAYDLGAHRRRLSGTGRRSSSLASMDALEATRRPRPAARLQR